LIKGRVYFYSDKCKEYKDAGRNAASALLVQSGLLATFFYCPMLNQPKSVVHSRPQSYFNNTGGTSKGIMTSVLPLRNEKADILLEQKRSGSHFY
jgi:hypothetical protein